MPAILKGWVDRVYANGFQHGILFYPGFAVLPPFVVYRTGKVDKAKFAELSAQLAQRLDTLASTAPIAFRPQNRGDYEIPALTLRDELAPGQSGFAAHRVE